MLKQCKKSACGRPPAAQNSENTITIPDAKQKKKNPPAAGFLQRQSLLVMCVVAESKTDVNLRCTYATAGHYLMLLVFQNHNDTQESQINKLSKVLLGIPSYIREILKMDKIFYKIATSIKNAKNIQHIMLRKI